MPIERRTVGVMFAASAISVANIYYCQPLLSEIGRSLGVSDQAIGYLPMWTQAGTALGMFGHVVGTILSGLLLGILLARVFSGFIGDLFGWRAVYWIAAGGMFTLSITLRYALPHDRPESHLCYGELVRSIVHLALAQPGLREAGIIGGMLFGAFSSFWATLVFFLATPPYHYGPRVAGVFGIIGAVGVLFAPWAGKLTDRKGPAFTVALAILTAIASYVVFEVAGRGLVGLIAGVILLDLGVQAGHVANQTRIYALIPEARSRLNTVYMMTYFLGGSLGSALGAWGWSRWGWNGVCAAGTAQLLVALVVSLTASRVRVEMQVDLV